jgi:NAD-dependent deacetylase
MTEHEPHLVVFTGAGLSAESGLPTFRGGDGLWEGHHIDQVCNQLTWKRNAAAVHRFYNDRRAAAARAAPNRAHRLLAAWQDRYRCTLITQNVDDLLERAGAGDVMHVHGRLTRMRCEACGTAWEIGAAAWDPETGRCPKCASRRAVRPDVIFFHERAPLYPQMWRVLAGLRPRDVLVVIGTDGAVIPIGQIAEEAPCRTVLNVLSPVPADRWQPGMIRPDRFTRALLRPAAGAAEELDQIVSDLMHGAACDD